MNIHEKLNLIQTKLKAPKSQYNKFGKYSYRNCEDILEAVKPLLEETKTTLIINDEVLFLEGRFYIKATATLHDFEGSAVSVSAMAREAESKKGMDEAQVTGATSSYARKYALNGLFAIDDTKDVDDEKAAPRGQILPSTGQNRPAQESLFGVLPPDKVQRLIALADIKGITEKKLTEKVGKNLENLSEEEYEKTMRWLSAK